MNSIGPCISIFFPESNSAVTLPVASVGCDIVCYFKMYCYDKLATHKLFSFDNLNIFLDINVIEHKVFSMLVESEMIFVDISNKQLPKQKNSCRRVLQSDDYILN